MSVGVLYPSCSTASSNGSIRPIDLNDGGWAADVEASSGDGIVAKMQSRGERTRETESSRRKGRRRHPKIISKSLELAPQWRGAILTSREFGHTTSIAE